MGFAQAGVCLRSRGLQIFPRIHVEHEFGLGSFTGGGVGVGAVVVDTQRSEAGHQLDQVKPAVLEAPVDMLSSDIVAATLDASLDSFDVQLRIGQADVPDIGLDALRRGLCEHARDRVGTSMVSKAKCLRSAIARFSSFTPSCQAALLSIGLSQSRVSR